MTTGHATVFPNFSYLPVNGSIRVWHPKGPDTDGGLGLDPRRQGGAGAEGLQLVAELVFGADADCRRVILGVPVGDVSAIARGEAAGFRYVVDVNLPDRELSLLAAEPAWVIQESMHLDDVPTT
jgi:hypothetical protein